MIRLAIDFGASETKIYLEGNGIVLVEPTCAAVSAGTRDVRAVGTAARRLNVGASDLVSFLRPSRRAASSTLRWRRRCSALF